MNVRKVVLISPPFSSQLLPTLELACAFLAEGVEATVACSDSFKGKIMSRGVRFQRLVTSSNINTGIAQKTDQPEEERRRLDAFLEATKKGPIETLLVQTRDRKLDMLHDPEGIRDQVRRIQDTERPDLWVSNQLSYGSTLALYCLGLPFVSLCLPHPYTVPDGKKIYGVPSAWPERFRIEPEKLSELHKRARKAEEEFTAEFNRVIERHDSPLSSVENAFSLTSEIAILFNYPDFGSTGQKRSLPSRIFMGCCFHEEPLDERYREMLLQHISFGPKILIVMGTFLSYRDDVIGRCIRGCKKEFPESLVIAGCGARAQRLKKLDYEGLVVEEFVPQKALLPHVDIVIHHGGSNSFTEALFYGRPMVILPFSSDQFDIARDAELHGIGTVLPPNSFDSGDFRKALRTVASTGYNDALSRWSNHVRSRGPGYAVRKLLSSLSPSAD
jgi:UDP:flavonoid glycosyltransferase YjiC (YdhE family)